MKKILYIVSSLRKAGPIVVLQNLIRHLDKTKFEVAIVKLMEDEPQRSVTKEFENDGIKIFELKSSKINIELFPKKISSKIDKIIDVWQPDIIHTHGYQALKVASKLVHKLPIVETLHCISGEDFIMTHGHIIGSYMNYMYHKHLKRVNHAAAISIGVSDYFKNHLPSLAVSVIPNGVQDVPKDLPSKYDLRQQLHISQDTHIFTVIGSLMDRKDPITIIRAFQEAFPLKITNVKLLFVGKGILENECLKLIGNDSRIQLLGWKKDPYKYLRIADWSISASHSEGFGLNFIESLIVGTPIISTTITAFKDFDANFPELGEFKFLPTDVEHLANLMKKSLHKKIDMMPVVERVDNLYSSKVMAKKYSDIYENMVK